MPDTSATTTRVPAPIPAPRTAPEDAAGPFPLARHVQAQIEDGLHPATRLAVAHGTTCGTCVHLVSKPLGDGTRRTRCAKSVSRRGGPDILPAFPGCDHHTPQESGVTTLGALARTHAGRTRLHDVLVEDLGRQIVDGAVPGGHPLPGEKEFADELFVSRHAARQAFLLLEVKGLVTTRHGSGTRVNPREHWNLLDRDVLRWILSPGAEHGPSAAPFDGEALRAAVDELASILTAYEARLRANPLYDALMRILSAAGAAGTSTAGSPDPTTAPEDPTP